MSVHHIHLSEPQGHLPNLVETKIDALPLEQKSTRPRFGSAKGRIKMAEDFDAPLEEFREYME